MPWKGTGLIASRDRILVSADGNLLDEDDIGASPMTLALLAAAGAKDQLVYYGYSNHIWDTHQPNGAIDKHVSGDRQPLQMRRMVNQARKVFGYPVNIFHNEFDAYQAVGDMSMENTASAFPHCVEQSIIVMNKNWLTRLQQFAIM